MNQTEKHPEEQITKIEPSISNTDPPSTPNANPDHLPAPPNDEAAQQDPPSTFLTGRRLWLVHTSVLLAVLLIALDESIVSTALPRLSSDFQELRQLTWVISAFLLTQAGLLLFFGQVLTIVSSKAAFLFCIAVFEAGSLLCALSPSINVLILGRAIQGARSTFASVATLLTYLSQTKGVGGAGLFISDLAIISQIARIEIRPILLSSFAAVFGFASTIAPLLGGVFTDKLTWRWCFYINLPFGAVSFLAVVALLPSYPAHATSSSKDQTLVQKWISLDWIGTALSVAMTVCLLVPLQSGGVTREWSDPVVIALLIAGAILLVILIVWEKRLGDRAMMPLSILLRRTQLGAGLAIFTIMIVNIIFTYWLAFLYQAKGVSAVQSGINIIPFMLSLVGGAGIGGWLNSATGRYTPYLIAGSVMCAVAGGLFFETTVHTTDAKLIGYQILLGFGQGLAINQPLVAIQAEYADAPHLIPQASSLQIYLQLLGAVCGISMAGAVFGSQLSKRLAGASEVIPASVIQDVKQSVSAIFSLPLSQRAVVVSAYIASMDYVFIIAVPASGITILAALLIKNKSIKDTGTTSVETAP